MDLWTLIFSDAAKDVSSTVILVGVVVSIFTGVLVPGRTHKRELTAAYKVADEYKEANERKDEAISRLLDQNSALLAGVRIADKFYGDFVPSIEEHTKPRSEVYNVGT